MSCRQSKAVTKSRLPSSGSGSVRASWKVTLVTPASRWCAAARSRACVRDVVAVELRARVRLRHLDQRHAGAAADVRRRTRLRSSRAQTPSSRGSTMGTSMARNQGASMPSTPRAPSGPKASYGQADASGERLAQALETRPSSAAGRRTRRRRTPGSAGWRAPARRSARAQSGRRRRSRAARLRPGRAAIRAPSARAAACAAANSSLVSGPASCIAWYSPRWWPR